MCLYSQTVISIYVYLAQICVDGEARLVNGSTTSEGRVEICYAGIWGSVCDKSWGNFDAAIVCLQLGFQGTSMYIAQKL
jgi:deleted-in-malignant-brain-tumors protein 1